MTPYPEWSTACPDWEARIVAGQPLTPCPPLYPDQAAAAWAIFSELRIERTLLSKEDNKKLRAKFNERALLRGTLKDQAEFFTKALGSGGHAPWMTQNEVRELQDLARSNDIYNLLREHKAKVTVKVMGIAASAASVIAMAGDEILMGDGAFLMIHNAWAMAIGNRHDMIKASEQLAPFDAAMASVYAARSGLSAAEAAAMMDKESWLGATQAVEQGFASGILAREQMGHDPEASADTKYLAMVEAAMARAGHSRSVRREAIKSLFSGTPGAAGKIAMPSAGTKEVAASLQTLINNLKGK